MDLMRSQKTQPITEEMLMFTDNFRLQLHSSHQHIKRRDY